jgi:TRAP-type C4-dicarboxylate transport system permease small subunit
VANREERQESRRQLGEAMIVGGALALVGTPIVYALRSGATPATWWWPTWWMLLPFVVVVLGIVIRALPASFDLRRALSRSRSVARRREHSR